MMGIGTSAGAYYDTEFHQQQGWESSFDKNEIGPDEATEPKPNKVTKASDTPNKYIGELGQEDDISFDRSVPIGRRGDDGKVRFHTTPEDIKLQPGEESYTLPDNPFLWIRKEKEAPLTSQNNLPIVPVGYKPGEVATSVLGALTRATDALKDKSGVYSLDPEYSSEALPMSSMGGVPQSEIRRVMRQQSNIVAEPLGPSEAEQNVLPRSHDGHTYVGFTDSEWENFTNNSTGRHPLNYDSRTNVYHNDPFRQVPFDHDVETLTHHPDVVEMFRRNAEMQRDMEEERQANVESKKKLFETKKAVTEKGPVKLTKDPGSWHPGSYVFQTDAGHLGTVSTSLLNDGKEIRVLGLYGITGDPNEYGKAEMKALFKLVADEYPTAEYISGFRVSGARYATGGGATEARMKIPGRGK